MNGCNVSFAVSQIEDCLELNFRYVDYQTLAHLSCSSCVYWISARATRAQRFLSVRESISASTIYGRAENSFINQDEFVAMKTLSSCKAPRCDKHQFRDKMTART